MNEGKKIIIPFRSLSEHKLKIAKRIEKKKLKTLCSKNSGKESIERLRSF